LRRQGRGWQDKLESASEQEDRCEHDLGDPQPGGGSVVSGQTDRGHGSVSDFGLAWFSVLCQHVERGDRKSTPHAKELF
jgi:hypothetical protein